MVLTPDIEIWQEAIDEMGVPKEFYKEIRLRRLDGPEDNSYSFAIVYNEGRTKRPGASTGDIRCHMCRMVNEARENPKKRMHLTSGPKEYVVTPNGFPPSEGAVLIISNEEREMYSTRNLSNLGEKGEVLGELLKFGRTNGYRVFHQTEGAGATIGIHEHFHGTTMYLFQETIGKVGFDSAEKSKIKGVDGVYVMKNFPFAHLIFDELDPEKIVNFLSKLEGNLPSPMENGTIPHTISQGEGGILIAPTRINVGRSMGSERAPGFFFVGNEEDFRTVNYEQAINFMRERFFPKEVGLEKLL